MAIIHYKKTSLHNETPNPNLKNLIQVQNFFPQILICVICEGGKWSQQCNKSYVCSMYLPIHQTFLQHKKFSNFLCCT
jgi:hypothetical protein